MNKIIVGMGEALWDCLPEGKKIGGAPANFAYHASQFGFDSRVVSAVGVDADVFQDVDKPGGEFCFLFGGKSAHIRLRDVHHLVDAVAERKGFKAFIIGIEVSEPDGFTVGLRAFRKRKRDVIAPEYAL